MKKYSLIYLSMMRYIYIGIVLVSALGQQSWGQLLVSPTLGGNVNWIAFDNKDMKSQYKVRPVVGFHAGGSVSFRVRDRFFLQTSFIYVQKGKILKGIVDRDMVHRARYSYIDVPLLYTAEFESHIMKSLAFKWYVGVGPVISYWLGGRGVLWHSDLNENLINPPKYNLRYRVTFSKDSLSFQTGEMNVAEPNRILLGLNVSAGLIFEPHGYNKVMVSMRYEAGQSFFSPTSKGYFGYPGILTYQDDMRIVNRGISLSLHYFIDLKTAERKKGKSTIKLK